MLGAVDHMAPTKPAMDSTSRRFNCTDGVPASSSKCLLVTCSFLFKKADRLVVVDLDGPTRVCENAKDSQPTQQKTKQAATVVKTENFMLDMMSDGRRKNGELSDVRSPANRYMDLSVGSTTFSFHRSCGFEYP